MSIARVLSGELRWHVEQGDAVEVLRSLPSASVDAVVTDPPAGVAFMGKTWDDPKKYGFSDGERIGSPPTVNLSRNPTCQTCGGRKRAGEATKACSCDEPDWNETKLRLRDREAFVAAMTPIFAEALRVMKPGAHGLIWALPRTSGWTTTALENAGFEVRDIFHHIFGSGFPKALDVAKAIDARLGAERPVVGSRVLTGSAALSCAEKGGTFAAGTSSHGRSKEVAVTAPATDEAKQWAGWATALKPAAEHWILVRKPLDAGVAENVLEYGTGALNIDGCRIATDWSDRSEAWKRSGHTAKPEAEKIAAPPGAGVNCHPAGRWPAHVALSHASGCEQGEAADYRCVDDCPVRILDEQATAAGMHDAGGRRDATRTADGAGLFGLAGGDGHRFGDAGAASRFFYCPKPSTAERELGCEHLPKRSAAELTDRSEGDVALNSPRTGAGRSSGGRSNHHPTVKSIGLMRWLCRLVTPPGGVVLDCFVGSGTTGCSALIEGFRFVGVERETEYVEIARSRIERWSQAPADADVATATKADPLQVTIFDLIGGAR